MTPDIINALFELFGALITMLSIRQLYQDKKIRGVSVWPTVFFSTWGFWNIFYYTHLDQPLSTIAGIAMLMVNTIWLGMVLRYRKA